MGYTHYWYRRSEISERKFGLIARDFAKMVPLMDHLGVKLAGPSGDGAPTITKTEIAFNGVEKCGHEERDLGITWPGEKAVGVAQLSMQHRNGASALTDTVGTWAFGAQLSTRTCGGDCSHENFVLSRKFEGKFEGEMPSTDQETAGKYFDFCKTAYKPYDVAVMVCLVIAKHYLKGDIFVASDGTSENWKDGTVLTQHFLGYGSDFRLDR